MIELVRGDILDADAEALVNTVNCVGIMGRGIALQFRKAFPENYKVYKAVCDRKKLHPGIMLVHDLNRFENPRYIINFPTKRHWKGKSKIEDIQSGLDALVDAVHDRKIHSIAIPPLGCGLGGLNWNQIRPMIQEAFADMPNVHVLVYEPAGAPAAEEMVKPKIAPKMTKGRAALLCLMSRYLEALMDPFVSLLEIHKLMYFMQEAGEELKLRYSKGTYGPYAQNLRHVLNEIEGYFIKGFGDAEDRPDKQIELVLEATQKADLYLKDHPQTNEHFARVVDLIRGFETSYGMELLATIHWLVVQEDAKTPEEAITKTYTWNDRKKIFPEEHIRTAWKVLNNRGWIRDCGVS